MNLLFLTLSDICSIQNKGIYTDLLREFIKNGHNVYVISPIERRYKETTHIFEENNAKILRLKIGNIQKTNIIEKGISTLKIEHDFIKGIKRYFSDVKFDLVLYSTPPITFCRAIQYVKKRDNAKTYLLLKDIFPQNAVDLGILSKTGLKGMIYKYFRNKEKNLYNLSDKIGCMSQANVDYILKHNSYIDKNKVEVCPNSIEPVKKQCSLSEQNEIRRKYGIPIDKTVFLYGGNLGKPQGIDFLIECLREHEKCNESFILIVGLGTEYNKLRTFFEKEKPQHSCLLSLLPKDDYDLLTMVCDVGLIFLDHRFTIPNFPSRLLSYMEAEMPVLAATDVNTDIRQVIEDGKFGLWYESDNVESYIKYLKSLCNVDLRNKMGQTALKYLEEHYTTLHSYNVIVKFILGFE